MKSGAATRFPAATISALTALLSLALVAISFVQGASKNRTIDIAKLPPAATRPIDFARDVKPIFAKNCYACHGPEKQKSDYRLDVKSSALKGGAIGGAIRPGDSAHSPMIHYVAGVDEEIHMPPKGDALSPEQVGILRAWIDQGAKWETQLAATTQTTNWSLRPLSSPAIPVVKNLAWVRTPLDAFVIKELEARQMSPSPEADRRTLIRRVTFDLTGLPPTPEEVRAFADDTSPTAYEKVIDRLLASPRYGERWARHWMDVVHYAESHGNDEDKFRPNAWPYRDYLIRSFNDDKPYPRFVREQVAGDVLYPDDPAATVATAFVAVGPWDESSQMGILDGTIDKQVARYLDRDDMIATTMSTFVSSTVHCARCHNHKFDPIPQTDYYALQAVFAGVDRIDRPYDPDPKVLAERRRLSQVKSDLTAATTPIAELLTPATRAKVEAWENARTAREASWKLLQPSDTVSTMGATLTRLKDGSVLASGERPDKDWYFVTARANLNRVTAIRLEVLSDPSLPQNGPGRADNGNLHLSEFKAFAQQGGVSHRLLLQNPSADFDQDGWGIERSLDNNGQTAWGIHPQEGKNHAAIFELKTPLEVAAADAPEGIRLAVLLEQIHGSAHLIGRFRLSVTDAPLPVRAEKLAEPVAAALATPTDRRTDAQRADLARHVLLEETNTALAKLPPQQNIYAIATTFAPQGNFKPANGPRPVDVLRRGDIHQPIEPAAPGALSCVAGLSARFTLADPKDEGQRRAALANWIADRDNVLTWRSIVNRVWHYHFSRGIAETPNDFGRMGAAPTQPELLDYLAARFRDDMHGSLKQLHRLIVTSAVYRQSSAHNPAYAALDGDNRTLWRMNRTRLDAEEVRDAILAISGRLDLTMYGPSARQFIETPGIHATPNADYAAVDMDAPAARRRSVYRFIFRTVPDPFMQTLDCPDASQLAPKRETSVTALQALAMLNDRFVIRQSEHLAKRLTNSTADTRGQVESLYQLAMARRPDEEEMRAVLKYAEKYRLANTVRMVLNSNEFMFAD
jgi:mono/diheme cytochrome c family protein